MAEAHQMAVAARRVVEWREMAARLPSPAQFRGQTRRRVWWRDDPPRGASKGGEENDVPPGLAPTPGDRRVFLTAGASGTIFPLGPPPSTPPRRVGAPFVRQGQSQAGRDGNRRPKLTPDRRPKLTPYNSVLYAASQPACLRLMRSRWAGSTQSLNGAPFLGAPGLRARTGT